MLVDDTLLNVVSDELGKAGPPEFHHDKLMGFEVTWVASNFMIMAMVDYGPSEGVIWENVHLSLVGEDTFRDLPVR